MLPTGTVTFLFTDVVGNVPIWERDPTAMKAALTRHHDILYAAAQNHRGVVFKILGDEFQIAFEVPENALEATLEAQRGLRDEPWGSTGPLTVRMGLHTGPAEVIEGVLNTRDYAVSHTINRVARIRSSAHGGQILLSSATSELLHGYRPEAIHLRDLGEVYLKGMSIPEHIFQVVAPHLPDVFPPLLSLSHPLHNLPLQLTSFIGREKEIAAIQQLLQTARLVTLTGPGGTGKTRLALQTASGLLEQYADGIWLVELAPLSDPALVPTLAARALGLREQSGPQTLALLLEYLEQKQLLLILDNCEHVIEACVRLADTLLQACPKLSILTSSRETLGIAGEVPFRVPPMTLPEKAQSPPLEMLAQYEAIRLFVDRATTASPGFTITDTNAPAILKVCHRLDGIPLAIELAAARVKMLHVNEIAQRLDDRFRLLTGGSRASLPRHQTLRASIDWSYELLSPPERTLLQRLSVFAGGWTLEGAEVIGSGDGIQACEVLELLGGLVDKSLIQIVNEADSLNRFHMLETIHQYAHEKLVEAGQAEAARHRHLLYYLELAETMEGKIRGPDQARILEQLETELDNLRLALGWSLEGKSKAGWNPEPGLRLAAALHRFWNYLARHDEGLQWLESLLAEEAEERSPRFEQPAPITPERTRCRAKALYVAAVTAWTNGGQTKAARFIEESRELYQSLGADGRLGYAYARIAYFYPSTNFTEIRRLVEESLGVFREEGDRFGIGACLMILGNIAVDCKEYDRGREYYEENLALCKEIGELDGIASVASNLGRLAYAQGNLLQAHTLVEESLMLFTDIHSETRRGFSHLELGEFDLMERNYTQAAAHYNQALSIGRHQGSFVLIWNGLQNLGEVALLQGNTLEAGVRFEESLAYSRKIDNKVTNTVSLCYLSILAWTKGELEQALRMVTDALNNCRASGGFYEANVLCLLGKLAFARGEINQAQTYFEQVFEKAFPFSSPFEYRDPKNHALETMAFIAAAQGQKEGTAHSSSVAARLLGATETWHQRVQNARHLPRACQEREACITALRLEMSEQAFTTAFTEGQAMTTEQAIHEAKNIAHLGST